MTKIAAVYTTLFMTLAPLASAMAQQNSEGPALLKDFYATIIECEFDGTIGFIQIELSEDGKRYVDSRRNNKDFETKTALVSSVDTRGELKVSSIGSVEMKYSAATELWSISVPAHVHGRIKLTETSKGEWEQKTPAFYTAPEEVVSVECKVHEIK